MPIFHAIVLGIVQGLTEFLPISSSGHLILVPWLFGWDEPGLSFDAALHLTGLILTKLDGTAKGGIVVAITRELGLPVQYVGTGESMEDLVPFDAETFVSSLFD